MDSDKTEVYMECLHEATELIKKGTEIPRELIERAIGKQPSCPSCTSDMDSFVEPYCRLPRYLEELDAFEAAAKNAAQLASN